MAKRIGMGAKKPAPLASQATDVALDAFDQKGSEQRESTGKATPQPESTVSAAAPVQLLKAGNNDEKAGKAVKVTGISLPAEQLLLLQAVAAARKSEIGGRASVSAVLSELIAEHESELTRRAGAKLAAIRALNS